MQTLHEQFGKEGRFYVQDNDKQIAEIDYILHSSDAMEINHTEVDEKYKGQNIGGTLVERAVELARKNNWKVIPTCKFAKAYINRTPALQDVLG
jgi:uncharacterized protein